MICALYDIILTLIVMMKKKGYKIEMNFDYEK